MRFKVFRDLLLLVAIAGAIWLAISYLPVFNKGTISLISEDKETEVGEYIISQLKAGGDFELIEDSVTRVFLDSLESILTTHIEDRKYDYHIYVYRHDMVNGFTLPGGNILLTTGLLKFADKPEEIALVLAHEMGHAEKKHVINRLIKDIGVKVIFSQDAFALNELTHVAATTVFDRRQEKEADLFALELLERSGVNPRVMASFFRKIKKQYNSNLEAFEMFMSHPNIDSRIRMALEYEMDAAFVKKEYCLPQLDSIKIRL